MIDDVDKIVTATCGLSGDDGNDNDDGLQFTWFSTVAWPVSSYLELDQQLSSLQLTVFLGHSWQWCLPYCLWPVTYWHLVPHNNTVLVLSLSSLCSSLRCYDRTVKVLVHLLTHSSVHTYVMWQSTLTITTILKGVYETKFYLTFCWLLCKDQFKWQYYFFGRIFVSFFTQPPPLCVMSVYEIACLS